MLPDGSLEFRLSDPEHRYASVRLDAGLGTLGPRPDLSWHAGEWSVKVMLPTLDRVEYGFQVTHTIADDLNPRQVDTGFGTRSVLEMPGYSPPAWLTHPEAAGTERTVAVDADDVSATVWSPQGLEQGTPAPLVLVHDGRSYADRGALLTYLAWVTHEHDLPSMRVLLVDVGSRHTMFAASEQYAQMLVEELLPAVHAAHPTTTTVAVGASLGALAALHAQWRHPGTFAGLFLQSGSFFTWDTDSQQADFDGWRTATTFVAVLHADDATASLPPVALTCGTYEENAVNNELMAQRLRDVGVPVTLTRTADLHNMTSWRDAFEPSLRQLLLSSVATVVP